MRFPPYPKYKPSGVEWLGEVPAHWELKRLKLASRLTDRKVEADEENPLPYVSLEHIESWTGRMLPTDPEVTPTGTANSFKASQTLFGKLRPYLAKACNPDFDGLCSTELLVLGGIGLDRRALLYYLLCDGFISLVDSSTYGSKMPRANWDFIGNCLVPVAPQPEQHAIADFLDRETSRIDTLIAKKRTLIERLKEKRTALISRTVTRGLPPDAARAAGLDPHPKLKPSGVEWLGEVPAHWEVMPLKWSSTCVSGEPLAGENLASDLQDGAETLVIGGNGHIGFTNRANVDSNVIVIGRVGALCGNVHEITPPAWVTDNALILTTAPHTFQGPYLAAVLRARNLNEIADRTAQPLVTGTKVRNERLPRPPVREQIVIARYLVQKATRIEALISRCEFAIERLQEYRTALITAAVTGKIDVRQSPT